MPCTVAGVTGKIAVSYDSSQVATLTCQVLHTYAVGSKPQALAFDGSHMWVANAGSGTVTKLNSDGSVAGTLMSTTPLASRSTAATCG